MAEKEITLIVTESQYKYLWALVYAEEFRKDSFGLEAAKEVLDFYRKKLGNRPIGQLYEMFAEFMSTMPVDISESPTEAIMIKRHTALDMDYEALLEEVNSQ